MVPEADDRGDGEDDVEDLEGFVEGVSERAAGLDGDSQEGNGGLGVQVSAASHISFDEAFVLTMNPYNMNGAAQTPAQAVA